MAVPSPLRIWLIGGTSDSRAIAQLLSQRPYPWIVSVVTERAQRLYAPLFGNLGDIHRGPLTLDSLPRWLIRHRITHIIDASHPFAVEISQLAIATGLPYLRYERPAIDLAPITRRHRNIIPVLSWEQLFNQALQTPDPPRILLTTGIKSLQRTIPLWTKAQWWARILPDSREAAIALGFPENRLILQRPAPGVSEEQALWQTLTINTVLTKASGQAGGLPQKIEAAIALQTRLLILQRPALTYPQQATSLNDVSQWLDRRSAP